MKMSKYGASLLIRESDRKGIQESDGPELQLMRGLAYLEKHFSVPREKVLIIRELKSGRYEDRPKLDHAYALIKKHKIPLLLFNDIDRFTRVGPEHYAPLKEKFKVIGCDIYDVKGIIQPERNTLEGSGGKLGDDFAYDWSVYAASEKAEMAAAQEAKDEGRKILGRMIPAEIYSAQQGRTVHQAPYGFRNVKIVDSSGRPQPSKEPVEEEARYVKWVFEGIAAGKDIRELCDQLNEKGFKTRTKKKWNADKTLVIGTQGGNTLTPKLACEMVERPAYAGFNCEVWTHHHPVPANHKGIVSVTLWNQANTGKWKFIKDATSPTGWLRVNLKATKTKSNYQRSHPDFPFKKKVRCHECGKNLYAAYSRSRNGTKHGYYFCSKGHKQVSQKQQSLHDTIRGYLSEISFTQETANRLETHLREIWIERIGDLNKKLISDNSELVELRSQADALMNTLKFIQKPHLIQKIEEDYDQLYQRIKLLEDQRNVTEFTEADINQVIGWAKHFLEHLDELVVDTDDEGLRSVFWSLIFEHTPTLQDLQTRTAQLSPLVRLKEDFKNTEFSMARQEELKKNQIWQELKRWSEQFSIIEDSLPPGFSEPCEDIDSDFSEVA